MQTLAENLEFPEGPVVMADGSVVVVELRGGRITRIEPDGKLYFSCGDRGFPVETERGPIAHPHTGAVLRCNLDGSELEVYHTGLRNPQELVFDEHGNLFTGENNSDGGDNAAGGRKRGDLVAALKINDRLFEAIAAVPWIPEPHGDDRVRAINEEIVPRLAKEGWALDRRVLERIWRGERDDASVMDGVDAASGLALQAIVKHARAFDRAYGKPVRERANFYPE